MTVLEKPPTKIFVSGRESDKIDAWFKKLYRSPLDDVPPIDIGGDGGGDGNDPRYVDMADFACAVWQVGFYINSLRCLDPEAAYMFGDTSYKRFKRFLGSTLYGPPPKEIPKSCWYFYTERHHLGRKNEDGINIFIDLPSAFPIITFLFQKKTTSGDLRKQIEDRFIEMVSGPKWKDNVELFHSGFRQLDSLTAAPCVWLDKIFKNEIENRLRELPHVYPPIPRPPRPWHRPPTP